MRDGGGAGGQIGLRTVLMFLLFGVYPTTVIRLGNHPPVYEGGLVTFVFGLGAFCSFPTALLQEEIC